MAEYHSPIFSKQHYELIAEILWITGKKENEATKWNYATAFAIYLSKDNPKFDKEKFFKAVGMD